MVFTARMKEWTAKILLLGNLVTSVFAATTSSTLHRELTANDLIYFSHEEKIEIVSRKKYMADTVGVPIATEAQHNLNYTDTKGDEETSPTLQKRCASHTVWTLKPVEKFLGWDVLMSNVVSAPPNQSVSIYIDEGYWLGEKLSLSTSSKFNMVKIFMKTTFGVGFDKSWTTTASSRYSFTIPPGKFGAVVSNPLTTRFSGYIDTGCIGNMERSEFVGDSFQSRGHYKLDWVEGVIGLCVGDTYPLQRCMGKGVLIS